jgi:hypothetical protein
MNAFIDPIVQLCYLVDDVDAAAHRWVKRGAGPFFRGVSKPVEVTYRERPAKVHKKIVFGQLGPLQIELFEPIEDPTLSDVPRKIGLHHVASFTDDLDAACAAFDYVNQPTLLRGELNGLRWAFVDTAAEAGHLWEIYERTPGMVALYEDVAAAAKDWDGSDPIRSLERSLD